MRPCASLPLSARPAFHYLTLSLSLMIPILILGLSLQAWAQSSTTWSALPGAATDIGADAKGDVWVIGSGAAPGGHPIYMLQNGTWIQISGSASRIAVDTDGSAWVVTSGNAIFHWNGSSFVQAPGAAMDIGVGANGAVWIIGPDQSIAQGAFAPGTRTVTGWTRIDGAATRIAVDPTGNPWVVNINGAVYHHAANGWTLIAPNGTGKDVAVGADGSVYLVSGTPAAGGFSIVRLQGQSWTGIGAAGVNVAAGAAGVVYATQDTSTQNAIISNLHPASSAPGTLTLNQPGAITLAPGTVVTSPTNVPGGTAGSLVTGGQLVPGLTPGSAPLTVGGLAPYQPPSTLPTGSAICPQFTNGILSVPCITFVSNTSSAAQYVLSHSTSLAVYVGKTYGGDSCPTGYTDNGDYCAKPSSYGRGAGYSWQGQDGFSNSGMLSRCQSANPQGCEMNGAIAYPKCNSGFTPVGCCVCSPSCPSGWNDIGVSCQKPHASNDCSKYPAVAGFGGAFYDPLNGGSCWECPTLLPRTQAAVNSTNPLFPPCAVGNSDGVVWQSPQYPEPGVYPFLTKGILTMALGNPSQADAVVGQIATQTGTSKAAIWQGMANSPGSSTAFKALIFSAMLSAAQNPNASVDASGAVYAFQKYAQARRTFIAQDAVAMYNYYLIVNAYNQKQALSSSIAGGGFSGNITGQLGISPGNYLAAAYSAALPDQNGAAFVTAMTQLKSLSVPQNATATISGGGFNLTYVNNLSATISVVADKQEEILNSMLSAAKSFSEVGSAAMVAKFLAGADLVGQLASAAVDMAGEVMTLTAQQDARQQYSQLISNYNQPVNMSQIMTSGSSGDQGNLVLWWGLATSPYTAGPVAGTGAIADAQSCAAYSAQCSGAKAAVATALASLPAYGGAQQAYAQYMSTSATLLQALIALEEGTSARPGQPNLATAEGAYNNAQTQLAANAPYLSTDQRNAVTARSQEIMGITNRIRMGVPPGGVK